MLYAFVLASEYAQAHGCPIETINQRSFGPTYIAYGVFQNETITVVRVCSLFSEASECTDKDEKGRGARSRQPGETFQARSRLGAALTRYWIAARCRPVMSATSNVEVDSSKLYRDVALLSWAIRQCRAMAQSDTRDYVLTVESNKEVANQDR